MHALVIDDEPQVRSFVGLVLSEDWEVSEAESAERAFEMLRDREWGLVVCDVMLGGEDGFSVLRRFKEESPASQVVLITGDGSASGAIDATAQGAFDYLLKPFTVDELKALSQTVKERVEALAAQADDAEPLTAPRAAASDAGLVGRSRSFVEIMKQVGRVAQTDLTVLLAGESGTGKELVARAASAQPPQPRLLRGRQLRRDPRRVDRVGTLRTRPRLVHRRGTRPPRPF